MIDPKSCIEGINTNSLRTTQAPYKINFILPESLPYFDGHFPSHPILPAIAVLDISFEFLKIILSNKEFHITSISSAKFFSVIQPKDEIEVNITPTEASAWNIKWTIGNKKVADVFLTI